MRRYGASPVATPVGKIFFCFETKSLIATLLALALVSLVWNLQPYYENIIVASTPCTAGIESLPIGSLAGKKLSTPPADPNKRTFQSHGSAAALFVQMGAYRGGPATFAVVGLASKPTHVYDSPWYKCEYVQNNGNASVIAKSYKMLPDWGLGRVYTVVVVNCTFSENPNADNSGGKLIVYAGESPLKFEKFEALIEAPGSYDESKYSPPYEYEYLYCGSSLYGDLNAARMREWMAYHAWFCSIQLSFSPNQIKKSCADFNLKTLAIHVSNDDG